MAQLLEFKTESGENVLVEIAPPPGMEQLAGDGSDVIKKATETFESAIASVKRVAAVLVETAGKISLPADTIEMEFALKASAKAGFYLASADSEAQIKIKLVWTKKPDRPKGESGAQAS
jgi:hypothetical protein